MRTSEKPSAEGPGDPTLEFEASRTLWDPAARADAPEDPVLGRWLGGRFRVLSRIGEGGMGAVYEVVDRDGSHFAAKVVSGETVAQAAAVPARGSDADWKRVLQRFVREAAAAREVEHPNVVKTIELGVDDELGLPFIVMELLNGIDLGALIREAAPLAPEVVARIGVEAARGLAAVHAAGIVHRDVKPSNIFLDFDVDEITVKVCDFGIAKQVAGGDQTSSELTHTGGVLGSPRYMAPEQVTNARDVDATADVYGLCASLYEAASGKALWSGRSSLGELIVAICTERTPELAALSPWVPRELGSVVNRGLSRGRRQRWQDMSALAEALAVHAASGALKREALRTHDTSLCYPAGGEDPVLSSVDALDPGFLTQGVPHVAVAAAASLPAARPSRPAPARARLKYALLALATAAALAIVVFASSRATRGPATEVAPARAVLRVEPPDVTVYVNGRPAEVHAGRVALNGRPGDAFEVTLERAGQKQKTRVYMTSAGAFDPPLLELPAAGSLAVASTPRPAASAAPPSASAPERAPKLPRGASRGATGSARGPSEVRSDPARAQPAEPKPAPTALEPKDQW